MCLAQHGVYGNIWFLLFVPHRIQPSIHSTYHLPPHIHLISITIIISPLIICIIIERHQFSRIIHQNANHSLPTPSATAWQGTFVLFRMQRVVAPSQRRHLHQGSGTFGALGALGTFDQKGAVGSSSRKVGSTNGALGALITTLYHCRRNHLHSMTIQHAAARSKITFKSATKCKHPP
jgi:hypothetical protein